MEDRTSKYRRVAGQWHNRDISGQLLVVNQIPGSISKVQGFKATICSVKEVDVLRRLLNNQPSQAFQAISGARERLIEEVERGLKGLHWKDFEILVDLVFRNAGWRRTSVIGETMKFEDIELEEPITEERYQVQVKSAATVDDFQEYAEHFLSESFRKLYFVVHSPDEKLANYGNQYENIELVMPRRLAEMVVDFGLTNWLLKKIR